MQPFEIGQDHTAFSRIGQTRSSFKRDHALVAPDGHVVAALPNWDGAPGVVIISPVMGTRFSQTLVALEPGKVSFAPPTGCQTFIFVLDGDLDWGDGPRGAGSYLYLPPGETAEIEVSEATKLLTFEKRYVAGIETPKRISGHEDQVEGKPFLGDPDATLQVLLPEIPAFDMAVNIFSFQPGARLPFAETHVMEHGLMLLDGEGIYRLGDCWYPVAAGDCIWMASFCPQWFACIGKSSARYIYYKDVNRDALVSLL